MSFHRIALPATVFMAALILMPAGGSAQAAHGAAAAPDTGFVALQARGQDAMGVDQYTSSHLFDELPDGGRIELQRDVDDPAGVAEIRRHLRQIQAAFSSGDFSIPAFVHGQPVPGTATLAELKDRIEYVYRDLPRGGELRLVTSDPEALAAIRAFMAFQRDHHRAGGMNHGGMDHGGTDHGGTDHGGTDHGGMDHGGMRQGGMQQGGMRQGGSGPGARGTDAAAGSGGAMGQGMRGGMMGQGDPAFAADMAIVHELVTNHRAITRTVVHLPDGIRTVTASESPAIARTLVEHVASMERRLADGEVFNLFSHTLPVIFENYDRIRTEIEYDERGVTVVQTSDDPALVAALQAHAAEVTELVDEGMIAMMRGMMANRGAGGGMQGMQGGMHGGMHGGDAGGHGGQGGMHRQGDAQDGGTP